MAAGGIMALGRWRSEPACYFAPLWMRYTIERVPESGPGYEWGGLS